MRDISRWKRLIKGLGIFSDEEVSDSMVQKFLDMVKNDMILSMYNNMLDGHKTFKDVLKVSIFKLEDTVREYYTMIRVMGSCCEVDDTRARFGRLLRVYNTVFGPHVKLSSDDYDVESYVLASEVCVAYNKVIHGESDLFIAQVMDCSIEDMYDMFRSFNERVIGKEAAYDLDRCCCPFHDLVTRDFKWNKNIWLKEPSESLFDVADNI